MKLTVSEHARFALPVIAENAFTASVSMVYSAVTGAIGSASLAAAYVGNQAMNLVNAVFAVLTVGSAILTARLSGAGDEDAASRTAEQTLFMSPLLSVAVSALLLILLPFTMRLLMPGAEKDFLREGTIYYRTILLSLPGLVVTNACAGILRAAGHSKTVLASTILSNLTQLGCVYLFTSGFHMGISGVAWAMVACRMVSAVYLVTAVLANHRGFCIDRRRVLKPDGTAIRRILRVGLPASVDSLAVQIGYVVISSMMVKMGALHASVNSVLSSVLLFTGITQGMGSACSTTLVGHLTGAGEIRSARACMNRILLLCESVSLLFCALAVIFSDFSAGAFTKDGTVLEAASAFMWIQIPYCFAAVGVNVCEPAVRVGGDVKYAMWNITCCVLLIRLPLTWLLSVRLGMGVHGVYYANITSLTARFVIDYLRICSPKWGMREL